MEKNTIWSKILKLTITVLTIGICYEGGLSPDGLPADTRTPAQKDTLWKLLRRLKADYPNARITGHRDLPRVAKECPCFDASIEYAGL